MDPITPRPAYELSILGTTGGAGWGLERHTYHPGQRLGCWAGRCREREHLDLSPAHHSLGYASRDGGHSHSRTRTTGFMGVVHSTPPSDGNGLGLPGRGTSGPKAGAGGMSAAYRPTSGPGRPATVALVNGWGRGSRVRVALRACVLGLNRDETRSGSMAICCCRPQGRGWKKLGKWLAVSLPG